MKKKISIKDIVYKIDKFRRSKYWDDKKEVIIFAKELNYDLDYDKKVNYYDNHNEFEIKFDIISEGLTLLDRILTRIEGKNLKILNDEMLLGIKLEFEKEVGKLKSYIDKKEYLNK